MMAAVGGRKWAHHERACMPGFRLTSAGRCTHAGLLAAVVFACASTPAGAALKCWTNRDGVRECGATVPPEYVGQGHEEVNRLGVKLHEQGRSITADEYTAQQAAERQAKAEAERLAAERSRRAHEDRMLLETYASEDDILLARDGRIAAVEGEIRFARSTVEKLRADLDLRIAEAAAHERKGQPVPAKLEADITGVRGQIQAQESFIEMKHAEQKQIRAEHDVLHARFIDLRAQRRAAEAQR